MAQKIDGLALMYDDIRRWSRSGTVKGAIKDETVADAMNVAIAAMDDLVIESAVPWAVRNVTVDDIGQSKGTEVEYKTRRLFIETDLGITDMARVRRLWRVHPTNAGVGAPIFHLNKVGPEGMDIGVTVARMNDERWVEDGDFDANGNADMAILLYNWGNALTSGKLKINYWFTPPLVVVDDFFATDANGDRTKRPALPRKLWVPTMEYAKLVILATTGDDYKSAAIWRRSHGPSGILERVRTVLAAFQVGEPVFVEDSMMDGEPFP